MGYAGLARIEAPASISLHGRRQYFHRAATGNTARVSRTFPEPRPLDESFRPLTPLRPQDACRAIAANRARLRQTPVGHQEWIPQATLEFLRSPSGAHAPLLIR